MRENKNSMKLFIPCPPDADIREKEEAAHGNMVACILTTLTGTAAAAAMIYSLPAGAAIAAASIAVGVMAIALFAAVIIIYNRTIECCTLERIGRKKSAKLAEYTSKLIKLTERTED